VWAGASVRLHLPRNGPLERLAGHARVEDEGIRELDWLTHDPDGSTMLPACQSRSRQGHGGGWSRPDRGQPLPAEHVRQGP